MPSVRGFLDRINPWHEKRVSSQSSTHLIFDIYR